MSLIPYGRHEITQADIDVAVATLRGDWLTQGPAVPRFEAALAAVCGGVEAVAMNSATSALHIACVALNLGPGDWLWTASNTFLASAYAGLYCGADVDFVDIDLGTGNMSAAALAAKLQLAEAERRLPKVVVPVHFAGQSCDMREIYALGRRYGFRIVEDASHAVGGSYDGGPVGDCRYSDVCVFSFHPVKIVTSVEGGAAMTKDRDLAERMRWLRSHGSTRDPALMSGEPHGPWYYEALELGWNYRLTDVQAAVGASQMARLADYVARREELAQRYDRLLADSGLMLPARALDRRSAWHLYTVGWNAERSGMTRREAFEGLRAAGVGVQVHYIPVHLQPMFQKLGSRHGDLPVTEQRYASSITLPLYPNLTDAQQDEVVAIVRSLAQGEAARQAAS